MAVRSACSWDVSTAEEEEKCIGLCGSSFPLTSSLPPTPYFLSHYKHRGQAPSLPQCFSASQKLCFYLARTKEREAGGKAGIHCWESLSFQLAFWLHVKAHTQTVKHLPEKWIMLPTFKFECAPLRWGIWQSLQVSKYIYLCCLGRSKRCNYVFHLYVMC